MSSEPEPVLEVENLGKSYPAYASPRQRLAELLWRRRPAERLASLAGVSFRLGRGEILGVIGPNGAGKSTLLQIIAGTVRPSSGSVRLRGRVTALLELGAGMNPEMTGRENIFLMGATYGIEPERVRERYGAIAEFSGLGEALGRPVKTYSSGMFVRLAFSVSTALEPDLLIVDEALAVGDMGFQARCLDRLEQLIEGGASILLASHDIQLIKNYCTGAICLDQGRVVAEGDPETVTERYYFLMRSGGQVGEDALVWHADAVETRFQSRRGVVEDVAIEHPDGATGEFAAGDAIGVRVAGRVHAPEVVPAVALMLRDVRGYNLYGLIARASRGELTLGADGAFECRFRLPLKLAEGRYSLTVRLEDRRTDQIAPVLDKHVGVCNFRVTGREQRFLGSVDLGGEVLHAGEVLEAPGVVPTPERC
ncbi:MAG: ABC transporter ATP-binding protein [Gammaproteobacteria bacterium]|nr:ABC transporter ATP-binding protein [Gammaproteobacteria bacterium]MBK9426727.1 ABC transporter ATP-binding protein [Gammaproteobacteria bacterium]